MSKKKKVSPVKNGKKKPANKPVKKAAKPVAKSKKPSKSAPPSAKKSASKPAAKKSAPVKTLIKKAVKAVKKVVKAVTKKPIVSAKKPAGKNSSVKPVAKIDKSTKSLAHNHAAGSKNGADKKLKSHIQVNPPEFKKETARKEAVATPPPEKSKKPDNATGKGGPVKKTNSDVLAITNTIPVKAKNEISMSKIASIARSITNPVKKTDSYAIKPEKEPTGKFEMEFVVHSSAEMLYEFLSTPSGLSEWFCDDLNIRNGIYTFIWDDQLQQARLLKTVDLQLVRFQWVDKTDGSYFEFRIQRDDLTNDIALIITDFAESASERESSKLLWHSQIEKLMHVIGSIF